MSSRPGTLSRRSGAATTTTTAATATPKRKTSERTSKGAGDSLHPILPRQPSFPSLHSTKSTSSTTLPKLPSSKQSTGRTSPLKPRLPPVTQQPSTSSLSSLPKAHRAAPRSSEDPETSFSCAGSDSDDSGDERRRAVPVRRPGFGARKDDTATAKEGSAISVFHEEEEEDEDEEDSVDGKRENVVVCLRVRPTRASSSNAPSIYAYQHEQGQLSLDPSHPTFLRRGAMAKATTSPRDEYEFRFDALHLSPAPTEHLYETKIRPVVRAAMNGFNGTVFAYGQTASGKTHTMMGTSTESGIIPLAIEELFSFIHSQHTLRSFSLRVSFLEIYNEAFRDLLLATPRPNARPLEVHGEDGAVKGLEERPVSMPHEVLAILAEGENRRKTGATDWNLRSSRSHCVFVVTIESMSKAEDGVARTSRLNLIDLAGSESATGQDDRRKEGAYINKSLLTLGTVIGKLTERSTGPLHIPYRDSKLTRLLQPALSGNSRVAIICTISPDVEQATESLSTLKFAKRAKMVITKAERGVLMTEQMMLKQYATQVEKLQAQIMAVEDGDLIKERDSAIAKVDELQNRNQQAEHELARKELELARLKEQLEHTKSFILTGPVLEANARRASGQFGIAVGVTPARGGKRIVSETGVGTPRASVARTNSVAARRTPRAGTLEKEIALERELEEAQERLAALSVKDDEIASLEQQLEELHHVSALVQTDAEAQATTNAELKRRLADLQLQVDLLRTQYAEATKLLVEAGRTSEELERVRGQLEESAKASAELANVQRQLDEMRAAGEASSASSTEQLVAARSELVEIKKASAVTASSNEEQLAAVRLELVAAKEAGIKQAAEIRAAGEASSASSAEQLIAVRSELVEVKKVSAASLSSNEEQLAAVRLKLVVAKEAGIKQAAEIRAAGDASSASSAEQLVAARSKLVEVKKASAVSLSSNEEQLAAVRLELVAANEAGVKQAADLAIKGQALEEVQSKLRAAERRAAAAKEAADELLQARDERIASLERELSFAKKQLASLTVSKASAVQAALESTSRLASERDLAFEEAKELADRLGDVEDLAKVQDQQRQVAEAQAQREKEEKEKEDAERSKELAAAHDKIHQLQQTVDAHILLEQQRTTYHTNQKAGTDALKSKLDALNARASTPVPTAASSRTRSGALRLSGDKVESIGELQIKNGELQAEVAVLKMKLRDDGPRAGTPLPNSSSSRFAPSRKQSGIDLSRSYRGSSSEAKELADAKEKERLNSVVDSQNKLIQAAQDAGEVWRQKFLALQKQWNPSSSPSNDVENDPSPSRPTLASLNLPAEPTRSFRRTNSLSISTSTAPAISSHSRSSSLHSSAYFPNVPPPLPASPLNTEKERKHRRETFGRDLVFLKESRVMQGAKERLESPTTSPTKPSFEGLPPSWSRRPTWEGTPPLPGTEERANVRVKKSSTDLAGRRE